MAPGYPLLLLCLLAATRPDPAEGDPTGTWGVRGAGAGRALGSPEEAQWRRPSSPTTSLAARAGAAGMQAQAATERRGGWPFIGWARVTQGGNVGARVAPHPPGIGMIPSQ